MSRQFQMLIIQLLFKQLILLLILTALSDIFQVALQIHPILAALHTISLTEDGLLLITLVSVCFMWNLDQFSHRNLI